MAKSESSQSFQEAIDLLTDLCNQLAIMVGVWLVFPACDPKIASGWFLTPYHKAYLPLLAIGSAGNFLHALRHDYRRAYGANQYLLWAALVGTVATAHFLHVYYWAPTILVLGAGYRIWLMFSVDKAIRCPQEEAQKEKIGPRESEAEPASAADAIRFPAVQARTNFAAVAGMKEVKTRMSEAGREVVTCLQKQETARNGIMLYGDPGNGKTFLAEALAGELGLPIIKASFGDLVSKWVGETSESVRQLFEDAQRQAPCLLFIDEIDSLIRNRNDSMGGGNSEEAKTTNILLTGLVDIRRQGVVVVAATNFLDKLDAAAIREGRFDFKVEITPPDALARAYLIKSTVFGFKGLQLTPNALAQATKRWEGFSVVRIQTVVDEAGRTAKRCNKYVLDYADLQVALRTIQGRQGDVIPENTPVLDAVILTPEQGFKLKSIAHRMREVEETEKLGGSVPSGILFWGPPGTGKTMAVRSLAKTTGWALKSVSGSDLMADTKKVDELAAFAKNNRPCILFIDEADDVLGHRSMSGSGSLLTNKLLAAIDGAKGKVPDVVWIAATNHPENIDEAALRGGRFTEKLEFCPPDISTAAKLCHDWMLRSAATFADDVNGRSVAHCLEGETPANISAILQQAVNLMIERKLRIGRATKVTLEDIEAACLTINA